MRQTYIASFIVISLLLTAALVSPAFAITGNADSNNKRSSVGLVIFYSTDTNGNKIPQAVSSGVLIAPNILLTAAHACITRSVVVVFDPGPIIYTEQNSQFSLQGVTRTFNGIAYPNPNFSTNINGKNGAPDVLRNDLAVVVLNEPVPTSVVEENSYGKLPSIGLVDTLPANTAVELVGYGMQDHLTPRNYGIQNTWSGLLVRNSASAKILSGNFAWSNDFIRCSANPGQGRGGISYGDSGGPVFLGQTNVILALNSYVNNPNCVGVTYHTRLDLSGIQNWINQNWIN